MPANPGGGRREGGGREEGERREEGGGREEREREGSLLPRAAHGWFHKSKTLG